MLFASILCLAVAVVAPCIAWATPAPTIVTHWGTTGTGNGAFQSPAGVAANRLGHVYVADSTNARIQRFLSSGAYDMQWNSNGSGTMSYPAGLTVDRMGYVYVGETGAGRVDKYTPSGTHSLTIGLGGGSGPGQFIYPYGIAVDPWGFVYVTDMFTNHVQKFSPAGTYMATFGAGALSMPMGIAIDPLGNIYVADSGNHRIVKFTSAGVVARTFGSAGTGPGQLSFAAELAFSADGNLLVADRDNSRVQAFSTSGVYQYSFGSTGAVGEALLSPFGVSTDGTGIYVSDVGDNSVKKFTFGASKPVGRVSGRNRYELAANVAKARWAGYRGMHHVIVVNGEDSALANALAVAPLAGVYDAPVLLTRKSQLSKETYNALRSMRRSSGKLAVHVIGDTRLISKATYRKIRAANTRGSVERINGHDPYALSVAISKRVKSVLASRGLTPRYVLAFNAQNRNAYFDALLAGSAAARSGLPMLAIKTSSVPSAVNRQLTTSFAGVPVIVVNSSAFVSDAMFIRLGSPIRLSTHSDRAASGVDIAETSGDGALAAWHSVGAVSTASAALSAAPYMGLQNGVLLFTRKSSWPAVNTTFLTFSNSHAATLNGMVIGSSKEVSGATKSSFFLNVNGL